MTTSEYIVLEMIGNFRFDHLSSLNIVDAELFHFKLAFNQQVLLLRIWAMSNYVKLSNRQIVKLLIRQNGQNTESPKRQMKIYIFK